MEKYIVSALKYRPATFKSVVGQHALTTTLKNAIVTNKLAHAYLFCGPRGVGKTTCARIFAKTINCSNLSPEGEACNDCESCRSFNEQRSLNIYELDAASNNSVDDMRALIEQVRIPPQIGKYKVYIIDEVHMLSTAAFNAFLKTLEEPPAYVIFILATTEKHKVLPTILSRCQIYDFNRIGIKDIVDHLAYVAQDENVTADRDALNLIAMKADGGMRDALSIFDQAVSFTGGNLTYQSIIENLNVLDYEYYFRLTDCILKNQVSESLMLFNEILNKGFEGGRFIAGLASHFRDLLVSHDAATVSLLEVGDNIRKRYMEQAQKCPVKMLYRAIKLCNDCDLNYKASSNKRLLVELTLIELAQLTDEEVPVAGGTPTKQTLKPLPQASQPVHNEPTSHPAPAAPQPAIPKSATPQVEAKEAKQEIAPAADKGLSVSELLKQKKADASSVPVVDIHQLGVSIKGNDTVASDAAEDVVSSPEEPLGNNAFNITDLQQQIRRFGQTLPIEDRALSVQLENFTLNTLSAVKFEFQVDNDFVAQTLGKVLGDMTRFVQKELNNGSIELSVKVVEENTNKRPIGRRETFQYLSEKNKELINFQKTFGLEFD
jgi:DNA polymerase-3 subunit gamma/tau